MERMVLRVLVIVLLGSTIGLAWGMSRKPLMVSLPPQPPRPINNNGPAPTGIVAPTGQPPPTGVKVAPVPPTGATGPVNNANDYFISIPKAKELYDQMNGGANIVFVDAREFVEYRDSRITGAINIPKRRFDGGFPRELKDSILGNAVVVYCHGELCTDSEAVIKRMIALNLQIGPYYIIKDGLPGWEKAGYPMEGEKVKAPR